MVDLGKAKKGMDMDMSLAVQNGVIWGVILSLVLTVLLFGVGLTNPEMMLNDYPPDIQAKYGPMSEKSKKQKTLFAIALVLAVIGILVASVLQLAHASGGEPGFVPVFVSTFVAVFTFNLFDLIVLDFLLFVYLQPKFIVLPGTEGMAGYRDYGFHFRGFLIGTVISVIASLVTAGIASLIFAFT
jgi:hypothetical protein